MAEIHLGYLDTTFHRDDFRRRDEPVTPSQTKIPFLIENKNVILVDDVLVYRANRESGFGCDEYIWKTCQSGIAGAN